MAVASDVVQGTLTTSAATLRTATATEYHQITMTNYSGSAVTVDLYVNGSADVNRQGKAIPLEAGGFLVWTLRVGNTDTIQAKASANTSVAWTDEFTVL